MLRSIIVDDEEKGRLTLRRLIEKHTPSVEVSDMCDSVESAIKAIQKFSPEIVFLDIEMPFNNGFHLLERIENPDFEVIFITAYNHYAIQAIKSNALDYLLKPIDVEELKAAISKAEARSKQQNSGNVRLESLLLTLKGKSAKIAVPTFDGLQMLNGEEIIKCVSDESYTHIFLVGGKKLTVSKLLKEYEELLAPFNFLRIHNSCLINLIHVARYVKGEGGYVVMSDGENCEVSRRKKAELLSRLSLLQL